MAEKISFDKITEQTFALIYQALWKKLYGVAYHYLHDKDVAQEIVQEVFVKLWLNRCETKEVADAEAYLLKALRNKVYDHFDSIACRKKQLCQAKPSR